MPWVRSGDCCRCGDCCRGNPWDDEEVSANHGEQPRGVVEAGYCPLFELHRGAAEGDGFCIGHNPPNQHSYYLETCAAWPTDPAQLKDKPNCTYKFEWVD